MTLNKTVLLAEKHRGQMNCGLLKKKKKKELCGESQCGNKHWVIMEDVSRELAQLSPSTPKPRPASVVPPTENMTRMGNRGGRDIMPSLGFAEAARRCWCFDSCEHQQLLEGFHTGGQRPAVRGTAEEGTIL